MGVIMKRYLFLVIVSVQLTIAADFGCEKPAEDKKGFFGFFNKIGRIRTVAGEHITTPAISDSEFQLLNETFQHGPDQIERATVHVKSLDGVDYDINDISDVPDIRKIYENVRNRDTKTEDILFRDDRIRRLKFFEKANMNVNDIANHEHPFFAERKQNKVEKLSAHLPVAVFNVGNNKKLYVFGTVHTPTIADYTLGQAVTTALKDTNDILLIESLPTHLSGSKIADKIIENGWRADIDSKRTDEFYTIAHAAKKRGINVVGIEPLLKDITSELKIPLTIIHPYHGIWTNDSNNNPSLSLLNAYYKKEHADSVSALSNLTPLEQNRAMQDDFRSHVHIRDKNMLTTIVNAIGTSNGDVVVVEGMAHLDNQLLELERRYGPAAITTTGKYLESQKTH